jgi:regulator of cell morphogenesis and NO signaling
MFLQSFEIKRQSTVSDIVSRDFRTAEVFRRHGIPYCCGARWPVEVACEMHGVNLETLKSELQTTMRTIHVSNQTDFTKWETNFLIDYIINIHHHYLKKMLPGTVKALEDFVNEHASKYPYLRDLKKNFDTLSKELMNDIGSDEEVLFPYIRQLAHAHKHNEPYAALFIKTLRKPVDEIMFKSHAHITGLMMKIRELTDSYNPPVNACVSHKVVLAQLKELDNDLMQHLFLEESILFPRALKIENEVLNGKE